MERSRKSTATTLFRPVALMLALAMLAAACGGGGAGEQGAAEPEGGDEQAEQTEDEAQEEETEEPEATEEPREEHTLTMANFSSESHTFHVSAEWFIEELESRTDGQVQIDYHGVGSLLDQGSMLEGGKSGVADIVAITPSVSQAEFPFTSDAGTLPGLWDLSNFTEAAEILRPYYVDDFAAQGMEVLWSLGTVQQWYLAEPIDLDDPDLSGRRIRTAGANPNRQAELLGATPTTVSLNEVPSAVATGLIDGLVTSLGSFHPMGLYSEMPCIIFTNEVPLIQLWAINSEALAGLPDDLQATVLEVAAETQDYATEYLRGAEEDIQAEAKAQTDCIYEFTPEQAEAWTARFEPLYDDFVGRHGEEAEQFLEQVRNL